MPRPPQQNPLDATITEIIASAAQQIAHAVRQNIAQEVTRLVGGGGPAPSPKHEGRQVSAAKKYNSPLRCIAPGCNKKHGGPRSGFFCEDHQKLSAAAKKKIKSDRKAGGAAASAAKVTSTKATHKVSANGAKNATKRKLTAAGRKRLSDLMKARWAAKKKAAKKE